MSGEEGRFLFEGSSLYDNLFSETFDHLTKAGLPSPPQNKIKCYIFKCVLLLLKKKFNEQINGTQTTKETQEDENCISVL